jgi:vacuolar-type H+-ATPase subunit E/Vma4
VSLESILEAIRSAGETQASAIENQARIEAEKILAAAQKEAERLYAEAYREASMPAGGERSRLLHRANFESLAMVGSARQALVNQTLEQVKSLLAEARRMDEYPLVLRRLLEECLQELNENQSEDGWIEFVADPRDELLITQILKDLHLDSPVNYHLKTWGGLNAFSQDGRLCALNTLETRLEAALPYLNNVLAKFFENEEVSENVRV